MYSLHPVSGVIKDGVHIKPVKSNPSWLEYQQWLKNGNVPAPAQVEVEPLESVLAKTVSRIKERRNLAEQSGFSYLGSVFDSNLISAIRINGAAQAAMIAVQNNIPFSLGWTAKNNSVVPMTAAEIVGMPLAMASHANACHEHARTLVASAVALFNAGDRGALEAFDFESGWPSI